MARLVGHPRRYRRSMDPVVRREPKEPEENGQLDEYGFEPVERGYEPIHPSLALARHAQEVLGADRARRLRPLEVQGRVRRDLQAQALHGRRLGVRLRRRVRAHLGLAVRARLRAPPLRARARARRGGEVPGPAGLGAGLHPVHGRAHPHEGDAAERVARGADRARRAHPRRPGRRGLLGPRRGDGLGSPAWRSPTSASSSTSSTSSPCCRSTAAARSAPSTPSSGCSARPSSSWPRSCG